MMPWRIRRDRETPIQAAPFGATPLVIVVGRHNFRKRTLLLEQLCADISRGGVPVCLFVASADQTYRFLEEKLDVVLGQRASRLRAQRTITAIAAQWAAKALILLFYPSKWRYFSDVLWGKRRHLSQELRAFIRARSGNRIYLLSNSAGCIAACTVEDEPAVEAQIGIGYPFRNPDKGEETYRTVALAGLQKPLLIIQGADDSYGNVADARRYPLSPMVRLLSVEGGHDYDELAEETYGRILALVAAFIGFECPQDAPSAIAHEREDPQAASPEGRAP